MPNQSQPAQGKKHKNQYTKQNAKSSTGFMAELEVWAEGSIYRPLEDAFKRGDHKDYAIAKREGIQAIKRQVLASYHNGLKTRKETINEQNDDWIPLQRD
jgi:hypothetical protein